MTEREVSSTTIALAFVVVIIAGASTAIGAAVVFFPKMVKLASRRVLASALAISAGVMTYVSFVEIFVKSVDAFNEELETSYPDDEDKRVGMANLYATLSFFAGVALNAIIDFTVRKLSNEHMHADLPLDAGAPQHHLVNDVGSDGEEVVVPHCIGCSQDPVAELNEWQNKAQEEIEQTTNRGVRTVMYSPEEGSEEGKSVDKDDIIQNSEMQVVVENPTKLKELSKQEEQRKLVRMGLQTALAIALHNFPEGLATFVAFLDDPSIGIAFAVAIAIHNIPEGFCVALPVYYATGNRTKAFLWGTFSGVTEPIGALIGWLFFRNGLNLTLYGVMFGIVGGMMVMISLRELLPTAFRYDPRDTVVTNSLIAGMAVMSLSLILFRVI
jgi:ZIP family zinc transporter